MNSSSKVAGVIGNDQAIEIGNETAKVAAATEIDPLAPLLPALPVEPTAMAAALD